MVSFTAADPVAVPGAPQPAMPGGPGFAPSGLPGRSPAGRPALPRRRPALLAEPARERRLNFDGLAIGGPLTAAFVGVLLADADLVAAGNGSGAAPVGLGSVRGPAGETVATGVAGASHLASGIAAAGPPVTADSGSSGAAIDPVSASVSSSAAATAPELGGASTGGIPQGGAAAAMSGNAGVGGAVNISMSVSNQELGEGGGAAGAAGGEVGDGLGPIGSFVDGTDGDDVIHGTPGDDLLRGGDGDDVIYGYAGNDHLEGNAGDDQLFGGAGDDLLDGGTGDDLLHGGSGDDVLLGATGDDQLYGDAGSDWLDGGPGNDLVDGGSGNDRLLGGTGDDVLVTDNIHDVALENVRGVDGGGIDTETIAPGFAGSLPDGVDSATFVFSDNLGIALPDGASGYRHQVGLEIENLTLTGTAGHDIIADDADNELRGDDGDNVIYGRGGDDLLIGNAGADRLFGGAGADRLRGGADDDILDGGAAADQLYGGAGDDLLRGGDGADMLYGEGGDDTYVIGLDDSAVDTVFDHEGLNRLTLDQADGAIVQTALIGDDLHVVANHATIAVVEDYRGHEDAWTGIDLGDGVVPFDRLMAADTGPEPGIDAGTADADATTAVDDDLLDSYLSAPSHTGTAGDDDLLGSGGADWLSGLAGDDRLRGGEGADVLQGGDGSDLLLGGAGDDRYVFASGENGLDRIRDTQGSNVAELRGFDGDMARGVVVDGNLLVVIDYAQIFTVEDFGDNPDSFAGIELNGTTIATEDLLA